ncbi:hypothetical protein QZH41_003455, partial [Actinostola sp. cb2023]
CTIATIIFAVMIRRAIAKRNRVHSDGSQPNQLRSAVLSIAERKAAKMVTYVALGFLFTRIIPLVMVAAMPDETRVDGYNNAGPAEI